MTIRVQAPNGDIVQFPEGTSDAVINDAMSKEYGGKPPSITDVIDDVWSSAGAGLTRGALSIPALPGNIEALGRAGLDWLLPKLGKENPKLSGRTVAPTSQDFEDLLEQYTGELHEPKTTAGKFIHTIGEFAPGALLPGSAATRVVRNVVAPAVGSEAAGQATEGTSLEPAARIAGAVAGSMAPNAVARVATPFPSTPFRQHNVAVLDAEGVGTTAGQRTGRKNLQFAESAAGEMPFAGARPQRIVENQMQEFTQAALRRAGIQAERATPDVMDAGFHRIGGEFDRLAANNSYSRDAQLARDLAQVVGEYNNLVPQSIRSPAVANYMHAITGPLYQGGQVPGNVYQSLRSQLDRAARGARGNPQLSDALFGLRNAMDDAMERSINPADAAAWRTARNEYRNILVLEDAAGRAGEAAAEGIISPANLRAATSRQNKRAYVRGEGDFSDLARAGASVLAPLPNSGTPGRLMAHGVISGLSAAGGALAAGAPGAAAGIVAAPILTGTGARVLTSRPVQSYLGNQAMPGRVPGSATVPGGVAAGTQQEEIAPNDESRWGKEPLRVEVGQPEANNNETARVLKDMGVPEETIQEGLRDPSLMQQILRGLLMQTRGGRQ